MSLICFGEALIDFLGDGGSPNRFTQYPGGAPANVAVGFSRLGGKSYFVGMFSNDMFGQFLCDEFEHYGVDLSYSGKNKSAPTAMAFVALDEDKERSFSFYRTHTADLQFSPEDFNSRVFEQAQIFHFCSNTLVFESIEDSTQKGLHLARDNSCLISFDLNLRPGLWTGARVKMTAVWKAIEKTDLLKVSRDELEYLVKHNEVETNRKEIIQRCFDMGVKLIVITDGKNKIVWQTPSLFGQVQPPVVEVVDTTAAGDGFVAGLLFGISQQMESKISDLSQFEQIIASEQSIKQIVEFATECGAICVTRKGAFPCFPQLSEIK